MKNCTPTTLTLSVAFADSANALVRIAPLAGDVIDTVGGIASGTPVETSRLTGEPRNRKVPATGSGPMTRPAATVVLEARVIVPTVRPAVVSRLVATVCVTLTMLFGTAATLAPGAATEPSANCNTSTLISVSMPSLRRAFLGG